MMENITKSKTPKRATVIAAAVVLLVAAGAMYWVAESSSNQTCGFCQRPLDAHLSVLAEIDGHKKHVCCASCAITEANQQHKPVRLLQVHDYPTGKTIDPTTAFYVSDSRAVACMHDIAPMDQSKHAQHLDFDRCSPGTFTFAKKTDAETFIRQNGGVLLSHAELMAKARYQ